MTRRAVLSLALLAALGTGAPARADDVRKTAIVVGTNDGGTALDQLQYAETDARKMAAVLHDLGDFPPERVRLLLHPDAATVRAALDEAAAAEAVSDAIFVFYYSGHADARGLLLGDDHVPWDDLKQAIRAVPADVHLGILDACRSGAITQIKGASVAQSFLPADALPAEGEAWIASSAAGEDAQESGQLQGSFFTHYLVSGLRGAADAGDGWVSLNEAYSYAYERTVARTTGTTTGTQHPLYDFRIQGNGDLKLTEVRRASALLAFSEEGSGEIAVLRQPEGTPIAEVAKVDGRAVTLAVEPGTYRLRRRGSDGTIDETTVTVATGDEHVVDTWSDAVAEAGAPKGGDDADYFNIRVPRRLGAMDLAAWRLPPDNAVVAGAFSVLPGAGQVYRGHWIRGAGFLSSALLLDSIGWGARGQEWSGSLVGPNWFTLAAIALHGWAMADATWGDRADRAQRGALAIGLEGGWSNAFNTPHMAGLTADLGVAPGLSIGLDRTGAVIGPEEVAVGLGTRLIVGPQLKRFQPGFVAAVGTRLTTPRKGPLAMKSALAVGLGLRFRLHLTPRYFVMMEGRNEWAGGASAFVFGSGIGITLGR